MESPEEAILKLSWELRTVRVLPEGRRFLRLSIISLSVVPAEYAPTALAPCPAVSALGQHQCHLDQSRGSTSHSRSLITSLITCLTSSYTPI
ncbi:hypothetical protein E2C01_012506 [Portunus trituberculatus]|uniref:Uncharacterized protein n=1 Tax=Portunus trituberculatus TaxID=210409 RepID=A0A5B7DE66_PORTR|nr:hypothetical protein [Portunus trituberculatus]